MALTDLVRKLAGALLDAVAAPSTTAALSAAHYDGLAKLLAGLPTSGLLDLIEGQGTVDADFALAEQAAAIVAAAFPPTAITAGEVELGLEALQFLLDAAGYGASPIKITGGVPAAFPPGGGPGIYRGR